MLVRLIALEHNRALHCLVIRCLLLQQPTDLTGDLLQENCLGLFGHCAQHVVTRRLLYRRIYQNDVPRSLPLFHSNWSNWLLERRYGPRRLRDDDDDDMGGAAPAV